MAQMNRDELAVNPMQADFRAAMRRLASTVSIVTCMEAGIRHGMTATAVASVSTDPATLLVCINKSASLHAPLIATRRFCVNLLQINQIDAAQAFSGKLKGDERFAAGMWRDDEYQLPALRDAQANVFCSLVDSLAHGTHSILVAHVDGVRLYGNIAPLVYQDGEYARTVSLPNSTAV